MFNINGTARIARVGEFKSNTEGKKSINLTLVDRRSYSSADGEKKSDFVFCKAYGSLAEFIHKYCSEKDENGKIISRIVEFVGTLETYQAADVIKVEKRETLPFHPDKVKKYNIAKEDVNTMYLLNTEVNHETTKTVLVLNNIKLWDSKVPSTVKVEPKKEEVSQYKFIDESTEPAKDTSKVIKAPKSNKGNATVAKEKLASDEEMQKIIDAANALGAEDSSGLDKIDDLEVPF